MVLNKSFSCELHGLDNKNVVNISKRSETVDQTHIKLTHKLFHKNAGYRVANACTSNTIHFVTISIDMRAIIAYSLYHIKIANIYIYIIWWDFHFYSGYHKKNARVPYIITSMEMLRYGLNWLNVCAKFISSFARQNGVHYARFNSL